ncbi:putative Mucin-5AC [Streptomyces afghaniensis 772]|uniref:Putative Mucin-5AC n=2 Tax=Streptomyces TaxID=1883 RepID=S4MRX0_9ACTN|nr:putative Mucin-5AC [Streptomyces afghaniensis 772]
MLDVSDEVRAEIGDEEADRLLAGETAPGSYDCTSCRTPGDSEQERTSTVLFIGDETAVLAFAHAGCLPSQVVQVTEEQLRGAVKSITGDTVDLEPDKVVPEQAVLGVTSGLVLIAGELHPALVVEPTAPIARPGNTTGTGDDFLPLLVEQGFLPLTELSAVPPVLHGWSVLLAVGRLHAVLQPGSNGGQPVAWWQAHQPLQVTEGWRAAANKHQQVLMFAAPVGSIGRQPREDLLRDALDKAAANGQLVAAALPLAGT